MEKIILLLKYLKEQAKQLVTSLAGLLKGEKDGAPNRDRKHGKKRGVVHGKDGLPKRRRRARPK